MNSVMLSECSTAGMNEFLFHCNINSSISENKFCKLSTNLVIARMWCRKLDSSNGLFDQDLLSKYLLSKASSPESEQSEDAGRLLQVSGRGGAE